MYMFNATLLPYDEFLKVKDKNADCPCENAIYCDNVKMEHKLELFGFGSNQHDNISIYNWTYLTTIAWPAVLNSTELMCTAHKNNVRLIAGTSQIPFTNNQTQRMEWIQQTYEQVVYYHFDGVTFDYEGPMLSTSIQSQQYVDLINETTQYFHSKMPGSQISVCVAWSSDLIDGRQYAYYNLSLVSDLLYIMDYAAQSQNWQYQCLAAATAPYQGTERGVETYLNLGIDPYKLILGLPWHGINYTCNMNMMESKQSKYCPIYFDTFRGVNCSDAAGNGAGYAKIYNLIDQGMNITEIRWDNNMHSPYFNYQELSDSNGVFQVWFDNPQSLSLKYQYAKTKNLRGIGPFSFPELYETYSTKEIQRAQQMWTAFDSFFLDY